MSDDDDADCVEHDWVLTELGARGTGSNGLDAVSQCSRCPAVQYEPAPDPALRPPL